MGRGGGGGGRGRDRSNDEYAPRSEEKERRTGWGVAPPSRHLWVGNLGPHVTRSTLLEHFLRFGEIENIAYIPGRSYAFVDYKKEEDAVIALRGLQGFNIDGMPLKIEFAKGDRASMLSQDGEYPQYGNERHSIEQVEPQFQRDTRPLLLSLEKSYDKSKGNKSAEPSEMLWIGFPSFLNVDEVVLRMAFTPFGEIEKITTFPGRSYAFVRYRSVVAACKAKEALQGKLFNNPRVNICFAKSDAAPAEQGRNQISGPFPSSFKSNHHPGLIGQGIETFPGNKSFESPYGEFHRASSHFISNFDRISEDASVMDFGRNSSVKPEAGSAPNLGGIFEHNRLQEFGLEQRMSDDLYESYRNRPAAERGAAWHDIPFERSRRTPPFEDSWGMAEGPFPSAKKLKTDMFSDKELPEYPLSDLEQQKHDPGPPKLLPNFPERSIYNKSFDSVPFGPRGFPDHSRNPINPPAESDDSWRTFDRFTAGPGALSLPVKSHSINPEPHRPPVNEEWKWVGTIAKGGTPVCRARCFPVRKVLDFMLPEFLNCTARTGLDMLSKHYYQAASTWVVFFVPENDADIVFYNEFMHYLGEKQRAAVAKLGGRITLFLVPPSDFSEHVLKVPGKVSISGVILKFQQPSSDFISLHHPLEVPEPELPPLVHRPNDGISLCKDPSFHKPNSLDFRALSQAQRYFSSSPQHLTPVTSNFPPPHKLGDTHSYSGSVTSMEKLPDFHGERRHDQLQHQDLPMPPNWSDHRTIPSSSFGGFPPPAPGGASHSFDNSAAEAFPSTIPRVTQATTSSSNIPVTSGIAPLPSNKFPVQQETTPQPSSSVPLPLQPEQLAQLAALLGQQKQSGKDPALLTDGDNKQPNLLQKPNMNVHAAVMHAQTSVLHAHASAPPDSSAPHVNQVQQFRQHPSTVPVVQPIANSVQQSSQQELNSKQDEADPQKRLQATLQLAAALLQQIQQQSKTSDQC
ncbi:flowering time control protein FPA [Cocos nucifera]|uniref:Flowering time control protein FPA n=1 Tax=Cocos nucifera TaxID=13894 RepID=A0A8K0IQ32_COCNU|nr:flowering time control protein FPA [Cocos nucifera]